MDLGVDLLFIFVLRLLDVGMATVRIVLLGKGRKLAATGLGFVEALVWVLAISRVLDGLDDPLRMVAFAAGFAAGTYLGALVEEWMALGQVLVRVIAPVESPEVATVLRENDFGATVVNGDGMAGEVRITFSVVPRRESKRVSRLIHQQNPDAYVTVESTTSIDQPHRHERDVRK
jgi:uncharacterized protein YebE (UPF0316 family)